MNVLVSIQEQLQQVDELIAHLEHTAVTAPRPSLAANLRALEKERKNLQLEFEQAAAAAEVDVYRYRILNTDRATIEGLSSAWREFQNVLSTMYDSLRGGGRAKKAKGKRKEVADVPQLELGFGYSFPGSVGVALTLPNKSAAGLFADDKIRDATETIFDFAKSYQDKAKVQSYIRKLGPGPVAAMYQWVETHVVHHYGVSIEWRRSDTETRSVLVQFEELEVLRTELSKATIDTPMTISGDLVVVNMDDNSFRLRADDGETIDGEFITAISQEQAARIPARYSAHIIKRTMIIPEPDGTQDVSYFLEEITPL